MTNLTEAVSKMVVERLNSLKTRPILESTLNRCLNYHADNGFIMVSACRTTRTPAENYIETGKLIADLKAMGLSHFTVYGGYQEETGKFADYETTMFIPARTVSGQPVDMDSLERTGLELGERYEQDSILVKKPGEHPYYLGTRTETAPNGDPPNYGQKTDIFTGPAIKNNPSFEYFTSLIKAKYANLDLEHPDRLKRFTYTNPVSPRCLEAPASDAERARREQEGELVP